MLAPCYLVHGGEPLQTEEIITDIKHQAAKQGYNSNMVFEVTTQFGWDTLLNKCQNLDLFAERTVVELRLQSDTVSKQGNLAIEQFLQQRDPRFCIIIKAGKLKPQTLHSIWVKHIQTSGKILQARAIPSRQWTTWLAKRFAAKNLIPNNDVLEAVAKCYEGNLPAATQFIDRLASLLPAGCIELAQIKPFLENNTQFSIFELVNAALEGQSERTFAICKTLQTTGVDPILVLWALSKELRTLLQIQQQIQSGLSYEVSAQQLGVWQESLARIKIAIERLSTHKLRQLLHLAHVIDTMIKGIRPGDPWEPLMSMSLAFANNNSFTMEDLYLCN